MQSRSPQRAYELKSSLRLVTGRIALPTRAQTFEAELLEEVRVGPERELAVPRGPGSFRVTSSLEGEITTYRFRFTRDFGLADGTDCQIQLFGLTFQARGAEPLQESLVLDEKSLGGDLALQGNLGLVVTYASCRPDALPLWEILVELEDGSRLRLLKRHEPPATANDTGPASPVHASLDLPGVRREVSDYWRLVYSALRHNRGVRHWVVLDPPASVPGAGAPVRVVEIVAPEPRFRVAGAVRCLDEDFRAIASAAIASYTRERLSGPGAARFLRGDVRDDGVLDLGDVVALLRQLFQGAPASVCRRAADANDDGRVNVADAVALLA